MKKKFLIVLIIFFLNGCGYTALYKNNNRNNLELNYEIVNVYGDSEINNYILTGLNKYQNSSLTEKIKINIDSTYSKSGVSNDKKGKTAAYNLVVVSTFDVNINEKDKKIIIKEKIRINRFDDTFEQKNYEKKMKKDISRLIVDRFINRVSILK